MRVDVELTDELVIDAQNRTGKSNMRELLEAGLTALIQRDAARRLADLGGSQPNMQEIPRRRSAVYPPESADEP